MVFNPPDTTNSLESVGEHETELTCSLAKVVDRVLPSDTFHVTT